MHGHMNVKKIVKTMRRSDEPPPVPRKKIHLPHRASHSKRITKGDCVQYARQPLIASDSIRSDDILKYV